MKDCQEFYALLISSGVVEDNRFVIKDDCMPMLLILANPAPDEIVFRIKDQNQAPSNVVGPDEAIALQSEAAVLGEGVRKPRSSSRAPKPICGSCRSAHCICEARPMKKQKAKKPKIQVEEVFGDPQLDIQPPPAGQMIRAKTLEGDEVISCFSANSSELADCLVQLSVCTPCGSFEEQSEMMTCSNCAHVFHRFCLGMKSKPLGYEEGKWRCASCKSCEVCQSAAHEHMILVCEKCDNGYHTFCLDPPLNFIPVGDWMCPKHALCISCSSTTAGDNPHHIWHDNDTLCHLCWKRIRAKSQCPSCLKAYDANKWTDSFMVGCDCGRWVHRGCDGISDDLYSALQTSDYENEAYCCIVCRQEDGRPPFNSPQLMALVKEEPLPGELLGVLPMELEAPVVAVSDGLALAMVAAAPQVDVVPALILEKIKCAFCNISVMERLGRLVPLSRLADIWVHTGCTAWANHVTLRKSGGVTGLELAIRKAQACTCSICKEPGAFISCRERGCSNIYHLHCSLDKKIPMYRKSFMCFEHALWDHAIPTYVETGKSKAFVTLQTIKVDTSRAAQQFVTETWEDRIKVFIAQNPSSLLNQKYDEPDVSQMSLERQERDTAFKLIATAVASSVRMQRGALQVASFGTIVSRGPFHSSRLLFAVGFRALRRFFSYIEPGAVIVYECQIGIREEDGSPEFIVTASDDAQNPARGQSPAEAWQAVASRFPVDIVRGQGDMCWSEEMFGFTPWVVSAMEAMVGVNACVNYNFQFWPRLSGSALGGQVNHPLGCARAIPYSRDGGVKEAGAFVYSHVTGESGGSGRRKKTVRGDTVESFHDREQPDYMRYRKLELHPTQLVVHKSRIHGMGVYSLKAIAKNDMVIEYQGEIIRPIVADSREREYERRGIPVYLWRLDEKRIVDATLRGNRARFINHCHDPNCFVDIVSVHGERRVMVQAKRDIHPGEELTYDYCFEGTNVECDCGSINCPGFMNLPPLVVAERLSFFE